MGSEQGEAQGDEVEVLETVELGDPEKTTGVIMGGSSLSGWERRVRAETRLSIHKQRGRMAVFVILLVALVLLATYVMIGIDGDKNTEAVLTVLEKALGPLITLLGTIVGFYFGGDFGQGSADS